MLYRRNCNTLLSSSLQRCYINGVCFAFQLAALWKDALLFVLGNINSHPSVKKKKGGGTGTWWADLGIQVAHNTHAYDLGQWQSKPMSRRNGRPSHLSARYCRYVLFLFHVKQQSCFPPSSARKPISCRQSIKPNQSTAIWLTGHLIN